MPLQNYCKPLMLTEPVFHIKAGRHAVVESMQQGVFLATCKLYKLATLMYFQLCTLLHISHLLLSDKMFLILDNFVSNDCDLDETKLWLVTGPNMGGVYVCVCVCVCV